MIYKYMSFLGILLCVYSMSLHSFSSLSTAQDYAQQYPEFPPLNTSNILNPDYSTFHKSITPTSFTRKWHTFLEHVGIRKKPLWSIETLKELLKKAPSDRQQDTIIAFKPTIHTRFFILGDLHSAFHSFVRILTKWHKEGIISEQFELLQPHDYIIFNGNAIDWSAYNAEALSLILTILAKNPQKAFYLRGTHEHQEHWLDFDLKRELINRASYLSRERVPLKNALNSFFNTLPLALYLQTQENDIVRISALPFTTAQENAYASYLRKPLPSTPQIITFQAQKKTTEGFITRAIIKSEHQAFSGKLSKGLQLLIPEKGATAWATLSAPTATFTSSYNFFYDAYTVLIVGKKLNDWRINLYWQDIRTKSGFQQESYHFTLGYKIQPGTTPTTVQELVVGCTLDLSKTSSAAGRRLQQGLNLRITKENQKGGVNGYSIRLIVLDDQYTPRLSLQNVTKLLNKYHTNTFISPLGTPTTEAILPFVKEKKTLILFPYTGASIFRQPDLTYFVHLRTSYTNEAKALVKYAVTTFQARKFAIFYQDDSYGRAPLEGAREAFKDYGISEWIETSYLRNNPIVETAAQKISEFNPDVILFFSTPAPSAALIQKIGINRVTTTVLMGISFLTDIFRNFLKTKGLKLILSQVIPNPHKDDIEIVREYQKDMHTFYPGTEITSDSLEGYLDASVFIYALSQIKGPVTNKAIIKQLENIKHFNFKGLMLNFDPQTRELLKEVWIDAEE